MGTVVLDTDVASAVLRRRTSTTLARQLAGKTLAITFVTVGELTKWTLVRQWGPQRKAGMQTFLSRLVVLPYSELPLATLNLKDFTDFAEHEGLQILPAQ
ncbi:MAG: hypothetical protein ACT4NP_05705 [Pseudonocardiales bacterium]